MDLRISTAEDGDPDDLVSLYRWLAQDTSLARHVRVSMGSPPPPEIQGPPPPDGRMAAPPPAGHGGTFEVINALLADAGAVAGLGSLVIAYRTWRGTRPRPPTMTIRYGDIVVTVQEGSEDEIRPLLDALVQQGSSSPRPAHTEQEQQEPESR